MSSATSRISGSLIKSLPPEVLSRAVDKLIDKIPPSLVVSAITELVKDSLEKGVKADLDITVLGIKVKGSVTIRSPP